jgi:ABC-type transporter Mla maintaining outer membrane lipid asymmetry permease subunit MlaE
MPSFHLYFIETYLTSLSCIYAVESGISGASLARGESFSFFRRNHALNQHALLTRGLVFALVICVAVGLAYIYWAFFACIVIAIGCLIGFTSNKNSPGTAELLAQCVVVPIGGTCATITAWHEQR